MKAKIWVLILSLVGTNALATTSTLTAEQFQKDIQDDVNNVNEASCSLELAGKILSLTKDSKTLSIDTGDQVNMVLADNTSDYFKKTYRFQNGSSLEIVQADDAFEAVTLTKANNSITCEVDF